MKPIKIWILVLTLVGIQFGADLPPELEDYLLRLTDQELPDDMIRGLESLYRNPPILSRMSREQVSRMFFLNEDQQRYIVVHHPTTVQILEEKNIIQDPVKLRLLRILTRDDKGSRRIPQSPNRMEIEGRIKTRLPEIPDSSFEGDNFSHSLNLEMVHGAWKGFGVCEKDYQEENRFDFMNAGIRYQINSRHYIIMGGYQVN
nr:hypothetical protein [Candidatus Delongbacteria bacterium]